MNKLVILFVAFFTGLTTLKAQQSEIYTTSDGAIKGFDAVAYFTQNKAVKGNKQFAVSYKGATWYFSSVENKEAFKKDPSKFEPQYGGYCAYGCSRGYKAKTEGEAFTIVDGKLYLNYNLDVRERWNKDQQGYIKKADANWGTVKDTKFEE
ncbi:MAG TPA: YHS domain-containing (seleno)protein [Chitinophagaceae bacterium]|nr:YHS domain-containing (seleno)protein [Chitinophagaceae bacterium]